MSNVLHRHSLRLPGYDYAAVGAYFVTICANDRECLFGDVVGGEMRLNDAGIMAGTWWRELTHKFEMVATDEYVVMPNHFHGILFFVGAPLRGRPATLRVHPENGVGRPHRAAPTVGDVIGWFKTMTTNAYIRGVKDYGWPIFNGRLWQRNYYERVIRDDRELHEIREYVVNNPQEWMLDKENPGNPS